MRIGGLAVLAVAGLLAGCVTPLDQCLWDAGTQTRELRSELAERQANLARGFRIERREMPVIFPSFCVHPVTGALYGCTDWVPPVEIIHHPIDPRIERERIELLERQIAREERREAAAQAQCRAAFPRA